MIIGYIYGIHNLKTDRWYIGQTVRPVEIRWAEHKSSLMSQTHNKKLQDSWNSSVPEDWEWIVLEEVEEKIGVENSEQLTRREAGWCARKKALKTGFNMWPPGKKYVPPEFRKSRWKNKNKKNASSSEPKAPKKKKQKAPKKPSALKVEGLKNALNKWKDL